MAKAMLIMDMPECCAKCIINIDGFCPAVLEPNECVEGGEMWKETPKTEKPDWCPLREVPENKEKKCKNKRKNSDCFEPMSSSKKIHYYCEGDGRVICARCKKNYDG